MNISEFQNLKADVRREAFDELMSIRSDDGNVDVLIKEKNESVSEILLLANNATSSAGTGLVTVNGTGALAGTGAVGAAVTLTAAVSQPVGAMISAGTSLTNTTQVGKLTATSVKLGDNSTYVFKLNTLATAATPGTYYDVIQATGATGIDTTALSGKTFNLSVLGAGNLPSATNGSISYTYELLQLPGVSGANLSAILAALTADTNFIGNGADPTAFHFQMDDGSTTQLTGLSGGTLTSTVQGIDLVYTPTPEPVVTGILGLAVLALTRRPRRRNEEEGQKKA